MLNFAQENKTHVYSLNEKCDDSKHYKSIEKVCVRIGT
jgi:hypothetical protein